MSNALNRVKEYFGLNELDHPGEDYLADETEDRRRSYTQPYRSEEFRRAPRVSIVPVEVRQFGHAKRIGEAFRDGDIVVFTLAGMPTPEARRVVDYAAGLCHGLRGTMQKLSSRDFGLIPEGVHVDRSELIDACQF